MNKEKIKEVLLVICVSYTIISVGIAVFESILSGTDKNLSTRLTILLFTAIAVCVLYTHPLLERLSPLAMVIVQYLAAMAITFLFVWITSFFSEMHPNGYFHVFRSFTAIYFIGAAFYYLEVILSVRKQNKLLQDIQQVSSLNKMN